MRTRVLLILTCLVSAIGLVTSGSNLYALKQLPDRGEVIPQPDHYVSFEGDLTRVADNGRTFAGRFYHRADGSECTIEAGVNPPGPVLYTITNYANGRYYRSKGGRDWIAGPLIGTGREQIPPVMRTKALGGLQKYTKKLALLAGQDGSLWSAEGLEAWLNVTQGGSMLMLAPELNFYPVVSTNVSGNRRVLSNIRIGTLSPSVFEPPPGANVSFVDTPFPPVHKVEP